MREYSYIYGVWFIPGDRKDFLLQMVIVDGKWGVDYRFRYYSEEPGDPFDNKDKKSGYAFQGQDATEETKARLLVTTQALICQVEDFYGHNADFVLLECSADDPKILFEIGSRPWAHLKMPKEAGK